MKEELNFSKDANFREPKKAQLDKRFGRMFTVTISEPPILFTNSTAEYMQSNLELGIRRSLINVEKNLVYLRDKVSALNDLVRFDQTLEPNVALISKVVGEKIIILGPVDRRVRPRNVNYEDYEEYEEYADFEDLTEIEMEKFLDQEIRTYNYFDDHLAKWWNIMINLVNVDQMPIKTYEWKAFNKALNALSDLPRKKLDFIITHWHNLTRLGRGVLNFIFAELKFRGHTLFGVPKDFVEFLIDYTFRYTIAPEILDSFKDRGLRPQWNMSTIFSDQFYPESRLQWKYFLVNVYNLEGFYREELFYVVRERFIPPNELNQRRKFVLYHTMSSQKLSKEILDQLNDGINDIFLDFVAFKENRKPVSLDV